MSECPRFSTLGHVRDETSMCKTEPQAALEGTLEVSTLLELIGDPRRPHALLILGQLFTRHFSIVALKVVINGLGSQHTSFHCIMRAFNFRHVQESS